MERETEADGGGCKAATGQRKGSWGHWESRLSDLFDQLKYNFGIVTWTVVLKNHIILFPIMSNFSFDNFKLNSCTLR